MKRSFYAIFMLFMIVGCATPPKEALKVDAGPYPEKFEEMIRCYLESRLEDPASLKDFKVIKPPEKIQADTYYNSIPIVTGDEIWECFIVYDAKNRHGKYIGRDLHVVWIRDLKVVAFDYADIELDFRIRQRQGDPCKESGGGKEAS